MKQDRIRVRPPEAGAGEAEEAADVGESHGDLLHDVDDLLDEIDAVLEDQLTLTHFRQRSGQ
jgi:hypothetical protein